MSPSSPDIDGHTGKPNGLEESPKSMHKEVNLGIWDTQLSVDGQTPHAGHVHSLDGSAEDSISPGFLSSMRKDPNPKTPGTNGAQRNRHGITISPTTVSKTPGSGLSTMFGPMNPKGLMTNTQMFDNTQAISSPILDSVRSDPLETRPSPEFVYLGAGSPSSRAISSSPTKTTNHAAGPRETYRSMDESQRRRKMHRLQQRTRKSTTVKVNFDDESQPEPLPVRDQRSPEPFSIQGTSPNVGLQTSPGNSANIFTEDDHEANAVIEVSDHPSSGAEDESMDEYDEFSQSVHSNRARSREIRSEIEETEMEVVPGSPAPVPATSDESKSANLQVADSQPVNVSQSMPPRPVEPSPMSSFVPGSQYGPLSSQTRALLETQGQGVKSSSLPGPPVSSHINASEQQEPHLPIDEVEKSAAPPMESLVPSSPPVLIGESRDVGSPATPTRVAMLEQPRPTTPAGIDERIKSTSMSDIEQNHVSNTSRDNPSEPSAAFETAATHISASQRMFGLASQSIQSETESPRKMGKVRKLLDIANGPTPPSSIGEIDVSIGMEIVSDRDRDFLQSMQPPGKLRRVRAVRGLNAAKPQPEVEESKPSDEVTANVDEPVEEPSRKRRRLNRKGRIHPAPELSKEIIQEKNHDATENTHEDEDRTDSADPSQKEPESSHEAADVAEVVERQPMFEQEPQPIEDEEPNQDTDQPAAPNRVFALFNGSVNGYWPATCLSVSNPGSSMRFNVRFDDGTCTSLERHHVCALDLRQGDIVKVDRPQMRTNMYTIQSLLGPDQGGDGEDTATDMHGNRFVQVRLKKKDPSKNPRVAAATAAIDRPVKVPISAIYVTQTMWTKFNSRAYQHNEPNRYQTPSIDASAPGTPGSRARRQTITTHQAPSLAPSVPARTGSLFANMAFAISYSTNDPSSDLHRDRLVSLIQSQSGTVIHEGFHELFSSSSQSLLLKPEFSSLSFVALLADSHSRNKKYIQALALSIPTLHTRWVEDSLRSHNPLPWARYLLPSGVSRHLSNAVRSRTIPIYDPVSASFTSTLEQRERLLPSSDGVIFLAPQGKKRDARDVYAFLSLAMGAGKTEMVDDIPSLHERMGDDKGWKWVHCSPEAMGDVARALSGEVGKSAGGGGKRKRRDQEQEEIGRERLDVQLPGGLRVVCDEWVIQSLILGA